MPIGPYFADFLSRSHKLVIELDGFSHDVDGARDKIRDSYLEKHGFHVIRFSNDDVMNNVEGVVLTIRAALCQAHP